MNECWRTCAIRGIGSLLAPFAAYLPAEAIHVSGVLAVVTAGLIAGRRGARVLSPNARLMGTGVWSVTARIERSALTWSTSASSAAEKRSRIACWFMGQSTV